MLQIASLVDVCERRREAGKDTYLGFVDLRKAFDVVPHRALFRKLSAIGVHGRTLSFLMSLYATARVAVSLPCGNAPGVPVGRGVRQGDPCSPILFSIFVNDIMKMHRSQSMGVTVKGLGDGMRIPGLQFADDLALLAESPEDLKSSVAFVTTWADEWGMSFGVKKCGVMCVPAQCGDVSWRDTLEKEGVKIHDESVPIVESYPYLGLPFHWNLDYGVMVEERSKKATSTLNALQPFMGNTTVPLSIRQSALQTFLIPAVCFGGEVLGLRAEAVTKPLQQVLSIGLKRVCQITSTKSALASIECMATELGVPMVAHQMAGARVRAFVKAKGSKTWAKHLVTRGYAGRRTWSGGARSALYSLPAKCHPAHGWGEVDEANAKTVSQQWGKAAREWKAQAHADRKAVMSRVSMKRYQTAGFQRTNAWVAQTKWHPALGGGCQDLLRLRVSTFWTGERAAKAGLIDKKFQSECPCCKATGTPETIVHFLLRCPKWRNQRRDHLRPLMRAIGMLGSEGSGSRGALSPAECCTLLLGGEAKGARVPLWDSADGTKPEGGELPLGTLGFSAVARFLQACSSTRKALVWETSTRSRRPNG